MPRWMRVVRGMVGTGLTFAAGVGAVAGVVGGVVWLTGGITLRELFQVAGKSAVVAFLLGLGFSGVLALTARGRPFHKLSLRLISVLGACAGLLYFLFLAMTGGRVWTPRDAIANFLLLTLLGAGSAATMFVIARKASGSSLEARDELPALGEGDDEVVHVRDRSKVEIPRR
jgi:hypothetical protein